MTLRLIGLHHGEGLDRERPQRISQTNGNKRDERPLPKLPISLGHENP